MATTAVRLSAQLSDLPAVRGNAPWPHHEYVRGWGVFGLPFGSGHVLALRVFPENDFSPYRAVWHRDPGGRWPIYVDGPISGGLVQVIQAPEPGPAYRRLTRRLSP